MLILWAGALDVWRSSYSTVIVDKAKKEGTGRLYTNGGSFLPARVVFLSPAELAGRRSLILATRIEA